MKKLIYIIICTLFLCSCEKEIDFNGELTDPRLVINSLVELDQPVSARIGKSVFFLDNESDFQCPDDLVATLYVNGNLYGIMDVVYDSMEMHYYNIYYEDSIAYKVDKRFQSDYRPVVGDIIKITASAEGFEDVEGITSAMPTPVAFQLVEKTVLALDSYYMDFGGDSALYEYGYLDIYIEVTDPNPGQTDLFRLSIQSDDFERIDEYYSSNYYVSHEFNDPIFGGSIESNDIIDIGDLDTRPEGVFSDALFDGGSYRIKVPIYFNLTKFDTTDPDFFNVPITLEHLSKEYYYYLNTCDQGDAITGFFAEPIQVYSNVTNGYGLVGGRSVNGTWLPLPLGRK